MIVASSVASHQLCRYVLIARSILVVKGSAILREEKIGMSFGKINMTSVPVTAIVATVIKSG
jgi:hypothetical protein